MDAEINRGVTENPAEPGAFQGVILVLGSSLAVMSVVALAPVLPTLLVVFAHTPNANFWVPALMTVPGLGAALLAPFVGIIGDRYGRRVPLIAFCALFALSGLLPLILRDFTAIFFSRIVVGFAQIGIVVLSTAMIGDYFTGARRDRLLAGQAIAGTTTALAVLPIAGFLAAYVGWRGPFLLFAVAAPLAVLYFTGLPATVEDSDEEKGDLSWGVLPWRWLSGFCLLTFAASILMSAISLQIGLGLATVGVTDAARIGFLSAVASTGIPLGSLLFWRLVHVRFSMLITIELVVLGLTMIVMRYFPSQAPFLVLAFVNLLTVGLMLPTMLTHLMRHLSAPVRARSIGVWQTFFSLGQFLSVGATGLVGLKSGATVLDAFWVLGLAALPIAAITYLVTRSEGLRAEAH